MLLCGTALVLGCRKVETRFDIVSYLDAGRPERFTERFEHGSFAVNGIGNYDIVFRLPLSSVEVPSKASSESTATQPAGGESEVRQTEEVWMSQIITSRSSGVPCRELPMLRSRRPTPHSATA